MKRISILAVFAMICMGTFCQPLYVGTYNLRNQNSYDNKEGNGWTVRHAYACNLMSFEEPDVFGTQELLLHQIKDMLKLMPGYDFIGRARDDGKEKGEYAAIFYNKERVKLLDQGDFWLNETPDTPKLGWDAACIRICSWGKFKLKKSGLKFFYFNLHMDHIGTTARREGAKLVVKMIREIAKGKPVILTGDFNVDQNNEIYQIFSTSGILNDSYAYAHQKFVPNGTYNAFSPELFTQSRIDHIFLSPEFDVEHYGVMTDTYWTEDKTAASEKGKDAPREIDFKKYKVRTPSDHYPVLAKIRYRK